MQFDVVTLFPGMFMGPFEDGMLSRARRSGRVGIRLHDLRMYGIGRHRQVDDQPYGGGGGMVLKPEPFFEAVDKIRERYPAKNDRIVLMSPQGRPFDAAVAERMACYERVIILCGRYEGVDERVCGVLADEEVSVGDYVLTGGELPAMIVIDAVARFIPGVLGKAEAAERDSFTGRGFDFPQYTRPASYRDCKVPEVLISGDHGAIERWRREQAENKTRLRRPDLLTGGDSSQRGS